MMNQLVPLVMIVMASNWLEITNVVELSIVSVEFGSIVRVFADAMFLIWYL